MEFNPFGQVQEIEIIIRDYVVLLTFISKNGHKWTIVYDLVLLSILSKTLMITDDHNYLVGEFINGYNYYND